MAMTASAIRFEPNEKEWIAAFAEMNGSTFSAQVRQWTLERLEDELDARDLSQAIRRRRWHAYFLEQGQVRSRSGDLIGLFGRVDERSGEAAAKSIAKPFCWYRN